MTMPGTIVDMHVHTVRGAGYHLRASGD